MNRTSTKERIDKGLVADLGHAYMFRSNGFKSRYAKNTYVVRYADREETFTDFRSAYSCAYQVNKTFNYVSIGSYSGVW